MDHEETIYQIERWIGHPRKMVIRSKITIEDRDGIVKIKKLNWMN